METQKTNLNCKVILFPQPLVGHVTPMLHLGNALYSKGFSITIIQSHLYSPNPNDFPNFTFHYIDETLWNPQVLGSDPWEMVSLLNKSFVAPFRDALYKILTEGSKDKEPVGCLISDPLWDFVGKVADEFELPRLGLRAGGLLAFVVYDSLPSLHQKGYFSSLQENQQEPVLEYPPLKLKDLPSANHDAIALLVKESKSYHKGMICNTFEELEQTTLDQFTRSLSGIPVFPIGPLHKYSSNSVCGILNQDHSSITWLNKQAPKSVLYVSFGTIAHISKEQFLEIAWGLARSKQPFLWVVQPELVNGSDTADSIIPAEFLQTVSGRGYIVKWAPQREVLGHPSVGGFWTHSGWNSTVESVSEGVPMICFPFFGDQKMNAGYVCDVLRIGLRFENELERQEIERVIRRLMVEKEGEEMRERAVVLKEKACKSLMEGGYSYRALDQLANHILSMCSSERTNK